ncbi:MAG: hypothetical protein NTW29_14225 [Bacteroidetes bacterium]|nr:hypothetical protein [Bacteroidota bacterium]
MSNDNLNTINNISQTLFRFATMRNPELSDPKNKNRRFIFRTNTQIGVFDSRVNATTTLQMLCANPASLPLTIETEESLKAAVPLFYELAVWVARNKARVSKAEFDEKINTSRALVNPVWNNESRLWDNLIYQVVTQKDFYAKETLMQFLHLNHILSVYDGTEEVYQDVINAKVVLPKELFKVSGTENTAEQVPAATNMPYNDKNMKFAEATIQLQSNKQLACTIEKLESDYQKEYQAAYQSADASYNQEIKPLVDEYQAQLSAMETRKKMLENRISYLSGLSLANPETFDRNSNIQSEMISLQETLLSLNVPAPEIPSFNFSFKPEIQPEVLESILTADEANTLSRVFGKSNAGAALQTVSSYGEITDAITSNSQQLRQTILDNTVVEQDTYAKVGGVLVPVNNRLTDGAPVPFSVKTYRRNNTSWFIMLTIENLAHNIMSGSYKVTVGGTEISSNTFFQAVNGVSFLFYLGSNIPAALTQNMVSFVLSGDVILEDGKTYTLNVTLSRDFSETEPVLMQHVFKGSSALTMKGAAEEPGDGVVSGAFIPSGFGMKNIGIADYRKVEQSTYCYVEGDVAHIENIMAREYKEKSTRRLRRSESQITTSSETEREQQTDTTTSSRHEMQSEIASILQESKDFSANTGFSATYGSGKGPQLSFNTGTNFATHNSKEESNRQAVTEAKEVTTRALDRIVTKVRQERIDKIMEEFEENNKHGFDNTKGTGHVVGVYRWVDKVVKNQIYNYGKRMMFEFMIPEPARLHKLGMKFSNSNENMLIKPTDPRTSAIHKIENFSALENEVALKYWAGLYNVELDARPENEIRVTKAISVSNGETSGEMAAKADSIEIPEGYTTAEGWLTASHFFHPKGFEWTHFGVTVGDYYKLLNRSLQHLQINERITFKKKYSQKVGFAFESADTAGVNISVSLDCVITPEAKNDWLQKTFNKIIGAYETEKALYEQAVAEAKVQADNIKGSNPGFYRKIENTILRRNCISYMINQDTTAPLTFGKDSYYSNNYPGTEEFLKTDIKVDAKLDAYAAFVKFMEQAFEWELMSYYFYPYYWGNRKSWADLYQFDDNDPVFRSFMQSGMARVIVTVRPGFEEAVRHYLATGKIWNGGEIPVIDDPLFLSIVDEMRTPKGTKEGEPWRERIPTALTILQADSIGLKVEKALPCYCEPGVKFDDNLGELCGSNFLLNQNQLGQNADRWMEISFIKLDNFTRIGDMDGDPSFYPRTYECLGNTITVDRDASWLPNDPLSKIYQVVADEVSQIEGVEAYTTAENGITFKINAGKINNFTFRKPGEDDDYELLKFSVDLQNNTLKITSPGYNTYGDRRILDKDGQVIPQAEYLDKVPLSKFLL